VFPPSACPPSALPPASAAIVASDPPSVAGVSVPVSVVSCPSDSVAASGAGDAGEELLLHAVAPRNARTVMLTTKAHPVRFIVLIVEASMKMGFRPRSAVYVRETNRARDRGHFSDEGPRRAAQLRFTMFPASTRSASVTRIHRNPRQRSATRARHAARLTRRPVSNLGDLVRIH
jgi:hypothetical protein